jgi:hypothetical protein
MRELGVWRARGSDPIITTAATLAGTRRHGKDEENEEEGENITNV